MAKTGFTLKMDNSKILKGIIETLAAIIDETQFFISPKEFVITAMDPSRICLLKLTIKKAHFDDFECNNDITIGLNLDDLDKILKRAAMNDSIELDFNPKDRKVRIKMKREGESRTRTFSLALIDLDINEIPMDNLLGIEYSSKWKMKPEFLVEAIKDAEIYSEILNIKTEEGQGLIFSSSGQIGDMNYELELEELLEHDIENSSIGAYSLPFLKSILKIASITEVLEISLKTDNPLKMFFKLLEGGELFYFLAPRVEEPEFEEEEYDQEKEPLEEKQDTDETEDQESEGKDEEDEF